MRDISYVTAVNTGPGGSMLPDAVTRSPPPTDIIMRNILLLILAITLAALAGGCGSRAADRSLDAAESLMDSLPDSALAILRNIDGSALGGERRARHALLLSQAYDKSYIDISDDSVINIALDYYSLHPGHELQLVMANYYKGVVACNAGDYQTAITHCVIADTLAASLGNLHYRAMANSRLSSAYQQLNDQNRDLYYTRRSLIFFMADNDTVRADMIRENLAFLYNETDNTENAMRLLDSVTTKNTDYSRAMILIALDREKELNELLDSNPGLRDSVLILSRYACMLIEHQRFEEARDIMDQVYPRILSSADSMVCLIPELQYYKATGQWQKHSRIVEQIHKVNLTVFYSTLDRYEARGQLQALDFLKAKEISVHEQSNKNMVHVAVVLAILLLCVIIVFILWRLKLTKRHLEDLRTIHRISHENDDARSRARSLGYENRTLRAELDSLRQQCDSTEAESDIDDEQLKVAGQIKDTIISLCDKYERTSSSDIKTVNSLKNEINALLSTETLSNLERYIDATRNSLVTRARETGVSGKDIVTLVLWALDFTNAHIALLTKTTYASAASRKSRLLTRLEKEGILAKTMSSSKE